MLEYGEIHLSHAGEGCSKIFGTLGLFF